AANKPPELPRLSGGFKLPLRNAKGTPPETRPVSVFVAAPHDYVQVAQQPLYYPADRKLVVKLQAARPLSDPPCPVGLELPSFVSHKGTFRGALPPGGDAAVDLTADDIRVSDDHADDPVTVSVTVDGYRRALLYRSPFATTGAPRGLTRVLAPAARITAPPAVLSGAPLLVPLEVDNALPGSRVRVEMDRTGDGN